MFVVTNIIMWILLSLFLPVVTQRLHVNIDGGRVWSSCALVTQRGKEK